MKTTIMPNRTLISKLEQERRHRISDLKNNFWRSSQAADVTRDIDALPEIQALKRDCTRAQKESAAAIQDANKGYYYPEMEQALIPSYEKAARAVGLVGVTDDISTYSSKDYEYNRVQPLLTPLDLLLALNKEFSQYSQPLTHFFYNVEVDNSTCEGALLKEAVDSLNFEGASVYPFEKLIADIPGFEEHFLKTMREGNRLLAEAHGFTDGIKLTKHHISSSPGGNIYGFSNSEWHQIKEECQAFSSAMSRECYDVYKKHDEKRNEKIASTLEPILNRRLDAIEDDMSWQIIQAHMPRDISELGHSNIKWCTGEPVDAALVVEVPEENLKSADGPGLSPNAAPFVPSWEEKENSLSTIYEESEEDEDLDDEVAKYMDQGYVRPAAARLA